MANSGDNIQQIIRKRLLGLPVATIAKEQGVSKTYVYNVLNKLPKGESVARIDTTISPDTEFRLIMDYLHCYPPAQVVREHTKEFVENELIKAIAEQYKIGTNEVSMVLYRLTSLHPPVCKFPYYSNIERWKTREIISFRDFAGSVGLTVQELKEILQGWKHMPLNTAKKIRDFTGLTLYEIYFDLLELDREERGRRA